MNTMRVLCVCIFSATIFSNVKPWYVSLSEKTAAIISGDILAMAGFTEYGEYPLNYPLYWALKHFTPSWRITTAQRVIDEVVQMRSDYEIVLRRFDSHEDFIGYIYATFGPEWPFIDAVIYMQGLLQRNMQQEIKTMLKKLGQASRKLKIAAREIKGSDRVDDKDVITILEKNIVDFAEELKILLGNKITLVSNRTKALIEDPRYKEQDTLKRRHFEISVKHRQDLEYVQAKAEGEAVVKAVPEVRREIKQVRRG